MDSLASPSHVVITECPVSTKEIFLVPLKENKCLTHDGYIQIGIFNHSVERHKELNPCIIWKEVYWYPDIFKNRYKRVKFQRTEACNVGSPKTDNVGCEAAMTETRPRDFPDAPEGVTIQEDNRLNRTL